MNCAAGWSDDWYERLGQLSHLKPNHTILTILPVFLPGKSPSETYSTSQDSDLGSFTMEITNNHGNRSRKNVSFEPKGKEKILILMHDMNIKNVMHVCM